MKDALKEFVERNREAFDDQETPSGVWPRIAGSLPEMKERSLWGSVVLWRAAAIVLMCVSVWLVVERKTVSPSKKEIATAASDFSDLESFYTGEIATKVGLIKHYDAIGDNDEVSQDLKKLDAMYQVLAEQQKSNPDKKVKDAMILNLLVRIDLLNEQLKKLEDTRRKKENKNSDS